MRKSHLRNKNTVTAVEFYLSDYTHSLCLSFRRRLSKVIRMNLSFKPWGIAVLCGAGAFALASVMFTQGWLPARSQAETTTQTAPPAPAATPVPAMTNTPPTFTQAQLDQ